MEHLKDKDSMLELVAIPVPRHEIVVIKAYDESYFPNIFFTLCSSASSISNNKPRN